MDNIKIGNFIAEIRKTQKMTQKELAEKLHVTDKAVSKWERGLCCPDISLLSPLSEILGVTTGELLNGEKSETAAVDAEALVETTLQYADVSVKTKLKNARVIGALIVSAVFFIGILVCAICDLAISGSFTWSLYPISASLFTWAVLFPLVKFEGKGALISLAAFSVLLIPFLFVLNGIIGNSPLLLPMGIRISAVSIVYLWLIYFLFRRMGARKLAASAIALLLIIPLGVLVNNILATYIEQPRVDAWDIFAYVVLAGLAFLLLGINGVRQKKTS